MPIFHFNVHDDRSDMDFDGTELDGLQAVRTAAMCLVGDLLVDKTMRSATAGNWELEVTDAEGLLVFRIGIDMTDYPPPPKLSTRTVLPAS